MRKKKGILVVFEGIDGAGAETQSKMLYRFLRKKGEKVLRLSYPQYKRGVGKIIRKYLSGKIELSPEMQTVFYLADFLKDKKMITHYLEKGYIIICDRYITSLLSYQGLLMGISKVKKIIEEFSFPKPDYIFYLRVSPETSLKRKKQEKRKLDIHEKNLNFLRKISQNYDRISRMRVWGKWIVIDGEKTKQKVFEEIKRKIKI